jgi:dimethylhistidine N-methyltransferase
MNTRIVAPIELRDLRPELDRIAREVCAGLRMTPKRVPSKYFYDARGSELFERICEQPEYYLTRVELALMQERIDEIAAAIGADATLIEFGSGSGLKTRLLLRHLQRVAAYVPIDISEAALAQSVTALGFEFPRLEVLPVCADFTSTIELPRPSAAARRRVMFFPGSTIGNFETREAVALLRRMRALVGRDGAALIGADLKKDRAELEAAYNDGAGVTAEFTLNMLRRFNRELGADFDLGAFRHRAVYNPMAGRIETHLVSQREQIVRLDGEAFRFAAGEGLLTEYSYKYSIEDFSRLAAKAGFESKRVWVDPARRFSIHHLEAIEA